MTKKSDKSKSSKKADADASQAELVKALESIKGLLEQGEEKLSIARESIQRANKSSQPISRRKATPAAPQSDEEIVPVLDDIVELDGLELDNQKLNEPDLNIPTLSDKKDKTTSAQIEFGSASDTETKSKSKSTAKTKKRKTSTKTPTNMRDNMPTVLDDELIDTIQTELEQIVRERLMKSMIRLENELKVEIRTHLDKLRGDK